uniref:4Fe-4S ferredoxin-type domain-containing protein n=1 Tax=Archaeoglobus fulgidus TaxID=2234 RepID=A0A7C3MDG0_ARCFL
MYAIEWDPETNGVILKSAGESDIPPVIRPVFFEELDLLGFGEFWEYERTEEPLLWCLNRTYYYRGERVARAVGGSFFEKPKLEIYKKDLFLEPINRDLMIRKNQKIMRSVVNPTLDFIYQVRKKYFDFHTFVGFSGGKDSIVLLDLIQRALPKDEYVVIFNDTSMELSETVKYVENVINGCPNLKFHITRHEVPAVEFWKVFGPPSRVHRWCCTVYKMLPTVKFFKEQYGKGKILFFDGIRAEENPKRAKMEKVTLGKNFRQINIHPILEWNSAVVWLYIFARNLKINPLYRYGIGRVGCIVCPFESNWRESIIGSRFYSEAKPYLNLIANFAGITDWEEAEEFIKYGKWKARVGGSILYKNKVLVLKESDETRILAETSIEKFLEWLKVLGSVKVDGTTIRFSFNGYDHIANYEASDILTIVIKEADSKLVNLLKTIALKSAYCVACGACEVNCPNDAITKRNGFIKVGENCSHCLKCLKVADRGCLRADSLKIHVGGRGMGLDKVGNYKTFGLRKRWLEEFFSDPDRWWKENSLGPAQFESMRRWLMDAEIVEKTKEGLKITDLGKKLAKIGADSLFTWAVIWTNLARNSSLIRWYVTELEWGKRYTREELLMLMGDKLSKTTKENGVQSLSELFRYSPLGYELELGVPIMKGRMLEGIFKKGVPLNPLKVPEDAVIYSINRLLEEKSAVCEISEVLNKNNPLSPFSLFGIPEYILKEILEKANLLRNDENHGKTTKI